MSVVNNNNNIISGKNKKTAFALTAEQNSIINSNGDICINAVAGSGKTTTIIEYAAARPEGARILYLAFNKSVKLAAISKFETRGLLNVKVETAHSLAYRHIMRRANYKVRTQGYKTHEIADLLGLQGNGEKHTEYILANHINKFITYFCNSDKQKVQDLNYLDTISDQKAAIFVRTFYQVIEDGTRLLLSKMDKGEIEIIHDFYLKKFQLSNPVLPFDYILFDEGQDASAAMLDVFLKQKSTKVIVGDTNQQIYGWRHAINSLEKTKFATLQLSASFRFPQPIADLATEILFWKDYLQETKPVTITGKGNSTIINTKATIGRTNLGLLLKAIDFITENRKVKHIYFEGNINSYTYADDGASLYDVLNLYNDKKEYIRDKLIQSMNDIDDLEEYIEKTEDTQLSMMLDIVKEYENEIPDLIKSLKNLHTGDEDRQKAAMVFSTMHRAKGMEYDEVYLVNDFINEAKLEKFQAQEKEEDKSDLAIARLNEEINLLYVAITRAKNKLHIPETLLPKNFPASPHIVVVKSQKEAVPKESAKYASKYPVTKVLGIVKKKSQQLKEESNPPFDRRAVNKDAYKPWTPASDLELKKMYENNITMSKIADHFGRTKGAIIARLKRLEYFSD